MANVSGLVGWSLIGIGAFTIYEVAKGRNPWTDLQATAAGKPLPAANHLSLAANDSIPSSSTTTTPTSDPVVGGDPRRSAIVAFVKSKCGGQYVWGGNGPSSYDCSGLTFAAYKSVGIIIPRTSGVLSAVCESIDVSDALPGDFVFYGHPAGHVGTYVGGGQMVAADHPNAFGPGVGIGQENVYPVNNDALHSHAWYGRWRGMKDGTATTKASNQFGPNDGQ